MRLIALFVIFVLLTGVMMMSIPDDAFAGKGDKRVNISVKDGSGKNFPGISCVVLDPILKTPISLEKTTKNGGRVGIFFPGTFDQIIVQCNGDLSGLVSTLKHTTFVLFVVK